MAWSKYWTVYGKNKTLMDLFWSVSFRSYKKLLRQTDLINIKNPKILEIGAGSGLLTRRILDMYGGSAVLVDSSIEAKKVFKNVNNHPKVKYEIKDAFSIKYKNKFDLVFSDGLIEHFSEPVRRKLIKIHMNAAKKGGHVILFAPHPSRRYKVFRRMYGKRFEELVGYEKPLKKEYIYKVTKLLGMTPVASSENIWEMGVLCKK